MFLAKSCYKKDHIKNGTLKLGTLHEYRATEIKHIADKHEGMLAFNLQFDDKVQLKTEWINTIFGGSLHFGDQERFNYPGTFTSFANEMHIREWNNEWTTISKSSALIIAEHSDSFVFCMSSIIDKVDCLDIFPEYDDHWYIERSSAVEFGRSIATLLHEKIISSHNSENSILPQNTPIEHLTIHFNYGHVSYIPRHLHITSENIISIELLMKKIRDTAFIKPPSFNSEREYRFHFTISSNGQIIEPAVKHVILASNQLQGFVV